MCGIAGYSRNNPRTSIPNGRKFAIALSLGIESRGRDATGFAWQERDDLESVWYSKRKGRATQVASSLALPYEGIQNLAAHTRFLTLGSAENNDNNHPVVANGVTAVHNGRVENHQELVALSGLERVGIVDSWAIPALLSQQAELGADHPTELLELIEGVAAIAWFDSDDPGVLHLARLSTRPLTVGWTKRGDLVYSSTRQTLEKGMKAANVGIFDVIDIPEGTYLRVRDGAFEEWSSFKVRHPVVTEDLDMPGAKPKAKAKKAPRRGAMQMSGLSSFDPDEDLLDSISDGTDYLDTLADFDSWESQVDARMDGIDWDNLVPRRGWN